VIEDVYHALELGAFLAERLGLVGLVPDGRILEFTPYFLEPLALARVVKGTSSGHPPWRQGR
jgi:hypothetical protein